MKEIRIKYNDDIIDEVVAQFVWSVINQGKISNDGQSYCYVTILEIDSVEYSVSVNDKTKSTMFYIEKLKKE